MMPHLRNTYGFSMLPMIMFMFIIVGMISAGIMMMGPRVTLGKQSETIASLDSIAGSVIEWSTSSNALPSSLLAVIGSNPTDSWGRNILYIFDNNLTTIPSGGVCGRQTTNLTVNGTANTAFALLSAGDGTLNWASAPALSSVAGSFAFPATVAGTTATLNSPNLFRIVTLDELKNRAGCYSTTRGGLKILNNELPKVCNNSTYSAQLFADGGAPSGGYTWSLINSLPAWIKVDSATGKLTANPLTLANATQAPHPTVTVQLANPPNPSIQKAFPFRVYPCVNGQPIVTFDDIAADFTNAAGNNNIAIDTTNKTISLGYYTYVVSSYACLWYKTNQTLAGKTFRSYFEFKMLADTWTDSRQFGDGFTLTLMQGANPTTLCGGPGGSMGYGGIPGDSFAVEFDIMGTNGNNDPGNNNHVAVIKAGNMAHGSGGSAAMGLNPTCTDASHPGCYYKSSPISWMEDAATHKARIEVATGCDAACGSCVPGSSGSYALVKVWIDCSGSCGSLTANYAAEAPSLTHCMPLPASMNNVKFGFTEGTGTAPQKTIISNFSAGFF